MSEMIRTSTLVRYLKRQVLQIDEMLTDDINDTQLKCLLAELNVIDKLSLRFSIFDVQEFRLLFNSVQSKITDLLIGGGVDVK